MWQCNSCAQLCSDQSVQQRLTDANQLSTEINGFDVAALEQLIGRQAQLLNPNHHLVVESKQKLAAILRSVCDNDSDRMHRADVLRLLAMKVRLSEELLPVLRILKPGISRLTGRSDVIGRCEDAVDVHFILPAIALYEQFTALTRIAEQKRATNAMSPDEYVAALLLAERVAKECVAMLVYEPRSTPEGQLAQNGMQHLKRLRESIARQQKQQQRKMKK